LKVEGAAFRFTVGQNNAAVHGGQIGLNVAFNPTGATAVTQ
jgi:hypothetical protein